MQSIASHQKNSPSLMCVLCRVTSITELLSYSSGERFGPNNATAAFRDMFFVKSASVLIRAVNSFCACASNVKPFLGVITRRHLLLL